MRVLQWSEIREFIEREHDKARVENDWRTIPCARSILNAYGDEWDYPNIGPINY